MAGRGGRVAEPAAGREESRSDGCMMEGAGPACVMPCLALPCVQRRSEFLRRAGVTGRSNGTIQRRGTSRVHLVTTRVVGRVTLRHEERLLGATETEQFPNIDRRPVQRSWWRGQMEEGEVPQYRRCGRHICISNIILFCGKDLLEGCPSACDRSSQQRCQQQQHKHSIHRRPPVESPRLVVHVRRYTFSIPYPAGL